MLKYQSVAIAVASVLSLTAFAQGAISLGTAADFALLTVPGNSNFKLSNVTVTGDVGVGNVNASLGSVTNMAPSSIFGTVYVTANTSQYSGPGMRSGSVQVDASKVNMAIADALAAQTAAGLLIATQTFGSGISSATTVTGNGGMNVIDVTGNITSTLSLTGTASDVFIVRVTGNLNLGGSDSIGASGSVLDSNVLLDFIGSGKTINTHVGNNVHGTLLAFGLTGNLDGTFDNIYGGNGGTISLLSGAIVNNKPFCPDCAGAAPEPASLGILGLGTLGLLIRRRRP